MIDAEIIRTLAEKVMGWSVLDKNLPESEFITAEYPYLVGADLHTSPYRGRNWNPLTSISDAFMLVEKMQDRGFEFTLFTIWNNFNAAFTLPKDRHVPRQSDLSESVNAARAICLAAIEALKGEK